MLPLAALSVAEVAACPESRHGMPCYTELAALSVADGDHVQMPKHIRSTGVQQLIVIAESRPKGPTGHMIRSL